MGHPSKPRWNQLQTEVRVEQEPNFKEVHPGKTQQLSRVEHLRSLPETNSEFTPGNGWLEFYFPIGEAYFQGQAVSFRECICWDALVFFPKGCRQECRSEGEGR